MAKPIKNDFTILLSSPGIKVIGWRDHKQQGHALQRSEERERVRQRERQRQREIDKEKDMEGHTESQNYRQTERDIPPL